MRVRRCPRLGSRKTSFRSDERSASSEAILSDEGVALATSPAEKWVMGSNTPTDEARILRKPSNSLNLLTILRRTNGRYI